MCVCVQLIFYSSTEAWGPITAESRRAGSRKGASSEEVTEEVYFPLSTYIFHITRKREADDCKTMNKIPSSAF